MPDNKSGPPLATSRRQRFNSNSALIFSPLQIWIHTKIDELINSMAVKVFGRKWEMLWQNNNKIRSVWISFSITYVHVKMPSLHCSKTTLWCCTHWKAFQTHANPSERRLIFWSSVFVDSTRCSVVKSLPRSSIISLLWTHTGPGSWSAGMHGVPSGFPEPQHTQSQAFRPAVASQAQQ